mmetsp:Transcript_893/g.1733  ORF Transcript_893/g.1733 Transcript_893/m.1733 type:complete len:90 (-) Transcript_893:411-680(-)
MASQGLKVVASAICVTSADSVHLLHTVPHFKIQLHKVIGSRQALPSRYMKACSLHYGWRLFGDISTTCMHTSRLNDPRTFDSSSYQPVE